jgi:hypothetical protein
MFPMYNDSNYNPMMTPPILLDRCQQDEVTTLRQELQGLRESTDEYYAIAVTMAAKERDLLQAE